MDAPIIWDFNQITDITALPVDEATLNITGGHFTTIANKAESKYTYYSRNIMIMRSNVLLLRNITTASKKTLRISNNTYMFKDVNIIND